MVSAALARVVVEHPAATSGDSQKLAVSEARSMALVELTRQSVADVVLDVSHQP